MILRQGPRYYNNENVRALQRRLHELHLRYPSAIPDVSVDGDFGPRTEAAVRALQLYVRDEKRVEVNGRRMAVDGVFGPQTDEAMRLLHAGGLAQAAGVQPIVTAPPAAPTDNVDEREPGYIIPVRGAVRISDDYGRRSTHGLPRGASPDHQGLDIAPVPAGKKLPIIAPIDGEVTHVHRSRSRRGYGNVVYIRDAFGIEHRFSHLDTIDVVEGQRLTQGQAIGTMGRTGCASAIHLHYEQRDRRGNAIDPTLLDRRWRDEARVADTANALYLASFTTQGQPTPVEYASAGAGVRRSVSDFHPPQIFDQLVAIFTGRG